MSEYRLIHDKVLEDFANAHQEKRFEHMERVVEMALLLNKSNKLGLDEEKIKIAGLLHDYAKKYSDTEQATLLSTKLSATDYQIIKDYPELWHAFLSSELVKSDFGITDPVIIEAIKYHSTGKPEMGQLSELIYVADTVEAGRTYSTADHLRKLAYYDFYNALYKITVLILFKLEKDHQKIHPLALEMREYYYQKNQKGRTKCSKIPN